MMRRVCRALWLCMALLMAQTAHAWCEQEEDVLKPYQDVAIVKLRFGHINLTDEALQPYGMLGSLSVPATEVPLQNATPDTVLWRCDAEDQGKIRFLVATHADWAFGGMYELGAGSGLDGVYYTAFQNIGLRLRMGGVTLSNHWQSVPVESFLPYTSKDPLTGKKSHMIAIRLQDIPHMEAELYKISQIITGGNTGRKDIVGCHYGEPGGQGKHIDYICDNYNGYLQLAGPGLHHDVDGTLATHSHAYTFNNGLAWGMYQAMSLSRVNTCVVQSATPYVQFAPVTTQQLMDAGGRGVASADFSVEVKCNDSPGKVSGTQDNKTAIGFQVSPAAFAAAKELKLVNESNGVKLLVSDQYGMPGFAQGVGIAIYPRGASSPRYWVGQPGLVGPGHPRNEANRNRSGWYPVGESVGAEACLPFPRSRCYYQLDFTARLVHVTGQEITPGKVRATAHVLVKVQ